MQKYIDKTKMDAKIFALVHDSILAEVAVDEVDHYCQKLNEFVQLDRGLTIPGCPIGTEFDVGSDYSFGKFEDKFLKNS
jgi:DNA polymerase I-like protein with 3'-5' exonuclease and polymerase domains